MRKLFALIGIIALVAAAPAADAPKSLDARTAIAKYERATSDAEATYRRALVDANKEYVADLTAARDKVLKNGAAGLDEANRINALIDRAESSLRNLLGIQRTFTIYAKPSWQPTMLLKNGDRIKIEAVGIWNAGSAQKYRNYTADGVNSVGYLEAKIGNMGFTVGSSYAMTVGIDEMLYLRMFDFEGARNDNSGSLRVTITVGD